MKRRVLSFGLLAAFTLSSMVCHGQDFRGAMKNIFGKDFKDYQWLNYPVNNFGVGTAYKGNNAKFSNKGFLCATFSCFDVPVPKDIDKWLGVNNGVEDYADPGCGGPVDATLQKNKELVLAAVLPQILSVIGVSSDLQRTSNSTAEITSARMCSRLLQQEKMNAFIRNLQNDKYGLQKAYLNDRLVLVVGDIVIREMSVHIKANQAFKAALDSKLQGQAEKVLGQGANFGVKLSKKGSLDYEMKIAEPVVAAVLGVRQGPNRALAQGAEVEVVNTDSPWPGWEVVSVPLPSKTRIRNRFRR